MGRSYLVRTISLRIMKLPLIKEPSAIIPMLMSFLAVVLVLGHYMLYGEDRDADEGTAAHLFQLLLVLQIPIIFAFLARWFPKDRHQVLWILAIEAGLVAVAVISVRMFT